MIYEVINPSDKCTFEAPDREVGALVVFLLGSGSYAGEVEDDETARIPVFIFGGAAEWFEEAFGRGIGESIELRKDDLIAALRSVVYCGARKRKAILASGGDLRAYNEAMRTSLNDMSGRAYAIADNLEAQRDSEEGE